MTKSKDLCSGCRNDPYNYGGFCEFNKTKECWSFKNAKIVKRREISIHASPPHDNKPIKKVLNCYNKKGYVYWEV